MESKANMGSRAWCDVVLTRNAEMKITGKLERVIDNKPVDTTNNTITTVLKNKSAQGCATGTFLAVNKVELTYSGGPAVVSTSLYAGGTGAEDYTTWTFSWTNSTGVSKTITALDLGYDMGGGGEAIYAQATGRTDVVANTETITYRWTITGAFTSGGLTNYYRYFWAKMIYAGTFNIGNGIIFYEGVTQYVETPSLEAGGTGAEAYHQWTATHTAVGTEVIDKIDLYRSTTGYSYTSDDITDKTLAISESLIAHVRISHS